MLRRASFAVAVGLVASLGGAAVLVEACSSSCQPGTLLIRLALLDDAPLADTITVTGDDPNAAVSESFPHTPNPDGVTVGIERLAVTVTWPGGYPARAVVNLTVRALAGGKQLGINTATVRLDDRCSETAMLVSNRGAPPDGGGSD